MIASIVRLYELMILRHFMGVRSFQLYYKSMIDSKYCLFIAFGMKCVLNTNYLVNVYLNRYTKNEEDK